MIWLIEEQLAYALGASVGDERVMNQAEAHARRRYYAAASLLPCRFNYFLARKLL
jgi:hypothetical protein